MEVFSKRRGKSTRQGSKVGHESGFFPSLIPSFPPSLPPSLSTKSGGTLPSRFALSSVAATASLRGSPAVLRRALVTNCRPVKEGGSGWAGEGAKASESRSLPAAWPRGRALSS